MPNAEWRLERQRGSPSSSTRFRCFCRRQGRVALVAKGAKKPSSNFRPVLLPLQPLAVTYTLAGGEDGQADIHTLKGAEWVGGHVMPTGGTARFASPINVNDFVKLVSVIGLNETAFQAIGPAAAILADTEGLMAHAEAVRKRLAGAPPAGVQRA